MKKPYKVALSATLAIGSIWLGAYGMHEVTSTHWTHFPIYFTSFCGFIGGSFLTCYSITQEETK